MQWLRDLLASDTGKQRIEKVKQLQTLAGDLGTTISKLALAWCLKNPNVSTVILGATRTSQLKENLDALNVLPLLTETVLDRIERILGNKPKFPLYG
jgi:aryl-alcohol dehydrogenase-like predicted oxidoreductase